MEDKNVYSKRIYQVSKTNKRFFNRLKELSKFKRANGTDPLIRYTINDAIMFGQPMCLVSVLCNPVTETELNILLIKTA